MALSVSLFAVVEKASYYLDQPSASKMVVTRLVAGASNTSSDYFASVAGGNYFAALPAGDMSELVV